MILRGLLLAAVTVGLAGCQLLSAPPPRAPACPAGQESLRTAQLFLGRKNVGPRAAAPDLQRFIDQEITPRFPDGVTVVNGGAQWQGSENMLMRDAAQVVHIVLPPRGDPQGKLEAVRKAYRARFRQESVLVVTQPACVAF
jgi:hypothetical protein